MIENKFKVRKSEWRKWSEGARDVFNSVFEYVKCNQDLMTHPKMTPVSPEHWETIAWNSAWIAALAVDDKEVVEVEARGVVYQAKTMAIVATCS